MRKHPRCMKHPAMPLLAACAAIAALPAALQSREVEVPTSLGRGLDCHVSLFLAISAGIFGLPSLFSMEMRLPTSQGLGLDSHIDISAKGEATIDRSWGDLNHINAKPGIRKIYLRFDLSSVPRDKLLEASLLLTVRTFGDLKERVVHRVYGIPDGKPGDEKSGLDESSLTWENAPQNQAPDTAGPDAVFLGFMESDSGLQRGDTVVFDEEGLTDFLKSDTNNLATLILIRELPRQGSTVFYSKESKGDETSAPTLLLRIAD